MAQFFRTSKVWVVDFTYDGHPRQWLRALPQGADGRVELESQLRELYGGRVRVLDVRPASAEEEMRYIRGDLPKNVMCPTGRAPRP